MSIKEFCSQLENYYSRAMTSVQSEPIRAFLEPLPEAKRQELYDLIISTCELMPRFAKIRELKEIIDYQAPSQMAEYGCPRCNYTGFVPGPTLRRKLVGKPPTMPRAELSNCKTCDGTGWIDFTDVLGPGVTRCQECNLEGLHHRQRAKNYQEYSSVVRCDCM